MTTNPAALRALSIAALLALAGACGPSFRQKTPNGFVELDDQRRYDYRAVTADGLVLAVREIDHEPRGTVEFWVGAIGNHMRQRGGYALLGVDEVKTARGLAGKQLRFGHDEGQKPHLYYITVFVTDDTLYLLEVGGARDLVERHGAEIAQAIQGFELD